MRNSALIFFVFIIISCPSRAQIQLDSSRFTIEQDSSGVFLVDHKKTSRINILDENSWVIDASLGGEGPFDEFLWYYSGTPWLNKVISFGLGKHKALFLQSEIENEAVILLYNPRDRKLLDQYKRNLNLLRKNDTCLEAYSTYHLLSDFDGDGILDLGEVVEKIGRIERVTNWDLPGWVWDDYQEVLCDKTLAYKYFKRPVCWYSWDKNGWDYSFVFD